MQPDAEMEGQAGLNWAKSGKEVLKMVRLGQLRFQLCNQVFGVESRTPILNHIHITDGAR